MLSCRPMKVCVQHPLTGFWSLGGFCENLGMATSYVFCTVFSCVLCFPSLHKHRCFRMHASAFNNTCSSQTKPVRKYIES